MRKTWPKDLGEFDTINELYSEINLWAIEHSFNFEQDNSKTIIDSLIADLTESLENYSAEADEKAYLKFDQIWKYTMQKWLAVNK